MAADFAAWSSPWGKRKTRGLQELPPPSANSKAPHSGDNRFSKNLSQVGWKAPTPTVPPCRNHHDRGEWLMLDCMLDAGGNPRQNLSPWDWFRAILYADLLVRHFGPSDSQHYQVRSKTATSKLNSMKSEINLETCLSFYHTNHQKLITNRLNDILPPTNLSLNKLAVGFVLLFFVVFWVFFFPKNQPPSRSQRPTPTTCSLLTRFFAEDSLKPRPRWREHPLDGWKLEADI